MDQLSIFVGTSTNTEEIRHQLANVFDLRFLQLSQIRNMAPEPYLVFDINMHDGPYLIELKEWLKKKPKGGKVIFVINKDLRTEKIQAQALGATDVIHRPINGRTLLSILWGDFDALARDRPRLPLTNIPAVGTAFDALENVFSSACFGASLDLQKVYSAGEALVDCIETQVSNRIQLRPPFASNSDPLKSGWSGLIHVVHRRAPRPTPRVSSRWRRRPWEVPVHPHG